MSASIYAGNLQRTGEYQTRGLRMLHGVRWTFQTRGHIHFPPLVAHGMAYVGSSDGCFCALGTHTGTLQWRFETEDAPLSVDRDDLMRTWPYTGVTSVQLTESTAFFGAANGIIYGLDLETGRQTWQFVGEEMERYERMIGGEREEVIKDPTGIVHMIVVDDLLLFWSKSGVSAVNVSTKERLWLEKRLGPFIDTLTDCPTVADQMLYGEFIVDPDGGDARYAYGLSRREVEWEYWYCDPDWYSDLDLKVPHSDPRYAQRVLGAIPVVNGTAYFVGVAYRGEEPDDLACEDELDDDDNESACLVAVDARTGKPQWSFALERDWGVGSYTALAHNLAYVMKKSGGIFAIDLATHEARWTRQLEGDKDKKQYAPPSLADGILYLPRRDGLLTALDALTGQDLWTSQVAGEITTPCTIADGVVYIAAGATIYALH